MSVPHSHTGATSKPGEVLRSGPPSGAVPRESLVPPEDWKHLHLQGHRLTSLQHLSRICRHLLPVQVSFRLKAVSSIDFCSWKCIFVIIQNSCSLIPNCQSFNIYFFKASSTVTMKLSPLSLWRTPAEDLLWVFIMYKMYVITQKL